MRKSVILGDVTDAEMAGFNEATENMRRKSRGSAKAGDIEEYLQFLEDRQALFNISQRIHRKCPIEKSYIL